MRPPATIAAAARRAPARSTYNACSPTPHAATATSAVRPARRRPRRPRPRRSRRFGRRPARRRRWRRTRRAARWHRGTTATGRCRWSGRPVTATSRSLRALVSAARRRRRRGRAAVASTGGCSTPTTPPPWSPTPRVCAPIGSCCRCAAVCRPSGAPRWRRGRSGRARRGGLAGGQQPGVRRSPRAGRLDDCTRCASACASRGSTPTASASTSATAGSPRSAGRSSTPTHCCAHAPRCATTNRPTWQTAEGSASDEADVRREPKAQRRAEPAME